MEIEHLLNEALALYEFDNPEVEFIRHNENITYKIEDGEKRYVLRIHQPQEGFSADLFNTKNRAELIQSELDIILALKNDTDIPMQTPIYNKSGSLVSIYKNDIPVTLLEWVDGQTVESHLKTPDPEMLKNIGALTASLHTHFFDKSTDKSYTRHNYDQTMIEHIAKRIKKASQAEVITEAQTKVVSEALYEMSSRFDRLDKLYKKSITHADLSKLNMIVNVSGSITPIDFSLCGYSHYHMDIGSLFGHFSKDEDRALILDGYRNVRDCELDPYFIEPYFAIQVVLFIACQYERATHWDWFGEAMERWCRDIFRPLGDSKNFLLA